MNNYPHGRIVKDPLPVGHGVPSDALYGAGLTDLASAWDTMRKARTSLRRAEHRINEADTIPNMPLPEMTASEQSVKVDTVPKVHITDENQIPSKSTYIDDQGRTSFMKAKMYANRKVSRLEDKYREDKIEQHSSALMSNQDAVPTRDTFSQKTDITDSHQLLQSTGTNYTNLTDSRAVRETELRFLNEDPVRYHNIEQPIRAPRTTHIDVAVPGAVPLTLKPGRYKATTGPVQSNPETSSQGSTESERDFVVMRNGDLVRKENMRKIVPRMMVQDGAKKKKVPTATLR